MSITLTTIFSQDWRLHLSPTRLVLLLILLHLKQKYCVWLTQLIQENATQMQEYLTNCIMFPADAINIISLLNYINTISKGIPKLYRNYLWQNKTDYITQNKAKGQHRILRRETISFYLHANFEVTCSMRGLEPNGSIIDSKHRYMLLRRSFLCVFTFTNIPAT